MKPFGAISLFLALASLAACDSYPRDIEGTRDRVVTTKQLRVGFGQLAERQQNLADQLIDRIAKANGAKVTTREHGSNEALFASLEKGHLDVVVTEVAKDSPWLTEVAVIEPLQRRRVGGRELGLSAVAANGENRWVMVLERQARDMRGGT